MALAARYSARLRCTQPTAGLGGEGTILERAAAVYAAFSRPRRPGTAAAPSKSGQGRPQRHPRARYGARLPCTQPTAALGGALVFFLKGAHRGSKEKKKKNEGVAAVHERAQFWAPG